MFGSGVGAVGCARVEDLGAGHGFVVAVYAADYQGHEEHEEAGCDGGAEVGPLWVFIPVLAKVILVRDCMALGKKKGEQTYASQHPSSVQRDVQAFNVDIRQNHARRSSEGQRADERLRLERAAEGVAGDHEAGDIGQSDEGDDHVAIDSMEDEGSVAHDGRELHGCQEACGG